VTRSIVRLLLAPVALMLTLAPPAAAQFAATPQAGVSNVEVDPIRCWWRTSAGAVRIGETFDVSLTCAVLQNQAVQVVPDESRLGNAVIQMAPFEVVSGSHPADLYSGQRRFFQYHYTIRIINPDAIGRDVRLPDILLHYRINSKVAANAAVQGRDLVYVLPPQTIRVASMVPADAPDIRDAAGEDFAMVEALDFRAGALQIVAVTLVAIGVVMTLLALVRAARGARRRTPADQRQLSTRALAGLAVRELGSVQREREAQGWTADLIDRAQSAARVAASCALGRSVSQRPADEGSRAGEGRLVSKGVRRGTSRSISSSITTGDLARALARSSPGDHSALTQLREALGTFATARYGQDATLDVPALDYALASAVDAARSVRADHGWPKTLTRRRTSAGASAETRA
jgi:hypothetical protein